MPDQGFETNPTEIKFHSVTAAHEAVIIVDDQTQIVSWNSGAHALFGWSAAEIQGQPLQSLLPTKHHAVSERDFGGMCGTQTERLGEQLFELQGLSKTGREFPFELSFQALRQGERIFARCVIRDLTRRKNAEAALRQQADLLDLAHDAIYVRALDGKITFWNLGAAEKYGWQREEALGKVAQVLLRTQFPVPLADIEAQVSQTGRWEGEILQTSRAGEVMVLESRWAAQRDEAGSVSAFLVINTDITARKKAEEQSRRAQQEAEHASAAKSEFLSRMSHELRTPLNAILGFAQLLELEDLGEEQADNVQQILRGGQHLLSLINEVLDMARIEAGHLSLSLEPIELEYILDEVVALLRPLARQLDVSLHVDFALLEQAVVVADVQRLKQVLLNLVSNAIKYNRKGGTVEVHCHAASDSCVRVGVTDSGAGLTPDQIGRLFQPFERLDAGLGAVQGTGLGLALSKRLVEAMDGQIGVCSVPGQGSTFWIQLPLIPAPEPLHEESLHGAFAPDQTPVRTVLYIDDNGANLRLLERLVARRSDIKMIAARQSMEGIEMARRLLPDLILLDIHLPDLSGDVVLKRLKAHPRTAHIPIVMLSADDTPGYAERLLKSGAAAYLAKPLDGEQFSRVLDETLNPQHHDSPDGEQIELPAQKVKL